MKVVEGICERLKLLADRVDDLLAIIRRMGQGILEECIWIVCHKQNYLLIDALNVKS